MSRFKSLYVYVFCYLLVVFYITYLLFYVLVIVCLSDSVLATSCSCVCYVNSIVTMGSILCVNNC